MSHAHTYCVLVMVVVHHHITRIQEWCNAQGVGVFAVRNDIVASAETTLILQARFAAISSAYVYGLPQEAKRHDAEKRTIIRTHTRRCVHPQRRLWNGSINTPNSVLTAMVTDRTCTCACVGVGKGSICFLGVCCVCVVCVNVCVSACLQKQFRKAEVAITWCITHNTHTHTRTRTHTRTHAHARCVRPQEDAAMSSGSPAGAPTKANTERGVRKKVRRWVMGNFRELAEPNYAAPAHNSCFETPIKICLYIDGVSL